MESTAQVTGRVVIVEGRNLNNTGKLFTIIVYRDRPELPGLLKWDTPVHTYAKTKKQAEAIAKAGVKAHGIQLREWVYKWE